MKIKFIRSYFTSRFLMVYSHIKLNYPMQNTLIQGINLQFFFSFSKVVLGKAYFKFTDKPTLIKKCFIIYNFPSLCYLLKIIFFNNM